MRTRYIGDMSPLPFLAQKINFEDARIASKIGVKIKRFGQSLVLYEKDETKDGKNSNIALLEELNIIKPGETIKGVNDWIYKVSGVDKVTSDGLLKIYFAYIHSGLPVVNKQLFLKQYRGETGEYPSAPLLNAIYGAAVRYMETCDMNGDKISLDIEMQEGWSERLFENLITFVKGKYSPCISTVQALVIGQNHRASLDEKMASGWLLNSAAQDLGLHRSSECWDIPDSEKETRKRVWWSVYIMDKWSAASTGRPQTIFDEDCDESYPNESADWDEVMDINHDNGYPSLDKSVAQKAKNENIPIYQPFVQLVKLSEILGRILQGLYTPLAKKHSEKHGSDAIVTYLDNALSEWRAALPPALQISSINVKRLDSHGKTPLLSMSGLMYLSYCTLLILLHRPFIEKDGGQKTRSSQSSLSICTSAATRCVDIAEKMHYRDFLLVSWNFAIYPVFTAALIHIYNAANPDSIVSDVAKSNLIKAAGVIKRLSKLSSGAGRLYVVLRQLMKLRKIDIDSCELSDTDVAPKKRARTTNWDTTTKKPLSNTCQQPQQHILQQQPQQQHQHQQIHRQQHHQQQQQQQQHQREHSQHSLEADPYSLRQFGLNMDSTYTIPPTPSTMPYQPNNNMSNMSNNNISSVMLPTNPADSFLFDQAMIDQTVFRNRPDNPFWSVPSSIELDDWTAYLLPQQPPPPPPTTNLQNSQQRGWNSSGWV
ncbi:fungal-specific transcription factor domain-containing protein [Helicostylum pulchrum]|nr:fungal-specific transcription factor domain-containing protein [Helicostylum pulchrum]